MLEILGTVFGSIFGGGATGLLGVIAQRFADYKNRQLDIELEAQRAKNRLEELKAQADIMKEEWAGRERVAVAEAEGAAEVADANAFGKSFAMEPQRFSEPSRLTRGQQWWMVMLDVLRGSVRPLLTVYLCVLTTAVWYQAKQVLAANQLNTEATLDVWKMVVGTILYLTTTCVLWWFGTRNKAKQPGA